MSAIRTVTHASDLRCHPSHTHPNVHQVLYIRKGEAAISVGENLYTAKAPCIVLISHLEKHAVTIRSETYDRIAIDLDPSETGKLLASRRLESLFSDRPAAFRHVLPLSSFLSEIDALFSLLHSESAYLKQLPPGESPLFPETPDMLFRSLVILLYRRFPEYFPWTTAESNAASLVAKIKPFLEENLEKNITLSDLEETFHLSRFYLSRIFHEVTGYSPMNYRMRCRIAEARELLLSSSWNITEICYRTGFADMSNFSRVFRREVGCSPTEYRRAQKE